MKVNRQNTWIDPGPVGCEIGVLYHKGLVDEQVTLVLTTYRVHWRLESNSGPLLTVIGGPVGIINRWSFMEGVGISMPLFNRQA